jgi:transcriptional regulator with XRE-family HTH domain
MLAKKGDRPVDTKIKTKEYPWWDREAYRGRLRQLRAVYGESQTEFAERLGIPFKRWNQYERGYPVSRQVAFILCKELPGFSIEWLWFGHEGGLGDNLKSRIKSHVRKLKRAKKKDGT